MRLTARQQDHRLVRPTVGQILEVMEISSIIGIHAVTTAVPILVEELAAAGKPLD